MTSNVNNTGIAHLAWTIGGQPFCKNKRAFVSVTPKNRMGYTSICKLCEKKLVKVDNAMDVMPRSL